ncbi:hypothetical protein FRC17_010148 [Serendipita sp. 399]|nr:hypothetical protein FRC17_010148 [Serendipita sp. 399]
MPGHEQLNELPPSSSAPPILRLPSEVLGYIFESFVHREHQSPWQLTFVCRQWRETALGTPRLWTKILIVNRVSHGPIKFVIPGKRVVSWAPDSFQVCVNSTELESALLRSGNALLEIRVESNDLDTGAMSTMWPKVFGKPVSDRLEKVRLDMQHGKEPVGLYLQSDYPSLVSIDLDVPSRWGHALLRRLLKVAKQAKFLRAPISNDLDLSIFSWNQLLSFEDTDTERSLSDFFLNQFLSFGATNSAMSPHMFNQLCRELCNVHTLRGVPINWPNDSTPSITFGSLSALQLYANSSQYLSLLRRLSLPCLNELIVTISGRHPAATSIPASQESTIPFSWSLPSLTKLDLNLYISTFSEWLSSLDVPRLQNLSIHSTTGGRESFPSVIYSNLRKLDVVANRPEEYFLQALEACPNVKEVTLLRSDPPKDCKNLILTRLSENSSNRLCPQLTIMGIYEGGLVTDIETAEPLIECIIEARIDVLESFCVNWGDDESIDYVTEDY